MKKTIYILTFFTGFAFTGMAQQVADFENFTLATDTFDDGHSTSINKTGTGFTSNGLRFENTYDTSWGGFWSKGFAISSKTDSTTSGHGNLYSSVVGSGYMSGKYAVGQQGAVITHDSNSSFLPGYIYVTNSAYSGLSMKNGDAFAKKFGGSTGHDSDWFLMSITGYKNGQKTNDSVLFYLADYRSADSTKDYIVHAWQKVDLTALGLIDSLMIHLTSSDNGAFGMNTPAFYCIDNLAYTLQSTGLNTVSAQQSVSVYPNPAHDVLYVSTLISDARFSILDMSGKMIQSGIVSQGSIDISQLKEGLYLLYTTNASPARFIKF